MPKAIELEGHVVEVGRAEAGADAGEGLAGGVVGVGGDFAVAVGELGDAPAIVVNGVAPPDVALGVGDLGDEAVGGGGGGARGGCSMGVNLSSLLPPRVSPPISPAWREGVGRGEAGFFGEITVHGDGAGGTMLKGRKVVFMGG